MQIKTTKRYHFTTVRMTIIYIKKCWQGYGEKGMLTYCWWGSKLVWSLWKTAWTVLRKLKQKLPAIPLPVIHPKEMKSAYKGDSCTPTFTVALFTIAKTWNQARYPSTDG